MKNNFGYWLGRKVRAFKEWKHPKLLKWTYVISAILAIFIIFFDFFVWLLMGVLCVIAVALYSDLMWGPTPAEKRITEQLEKINDSLGHNRRIDR
ncbi:hypothetical protein [Mannheimia haemolytica]